MPLTAPADSSARIESAFKARQKRGPGRGRDAPGRLGQRIPYGRASVKTNVTVQQHSALAPTCHTLRSCGLSPLSRGAKTAGEVTSCGLDVDRARGRRPFRRATSPHRESTARRLARPSSLLPDRSGRHRVLRAPSLTPPPSPRVCTMPRRDRSVDSERSRGRARPSSRAASRKTTRSPRAGCAARAGEREKLLADVREATSALTTALAALERHEALPQDMLLQVLERTTAKANKPPPPPPPKRVPRPGTIATPKRRPKGVDFDFVVDRAILQRASAEAGGRARSTSPTMTRRVIPGALLVPTAQQRAHSVSPERSPRATSVGRTTLLRPAQFGTGQHTVPLPTAAARANGQSSRRREAALEQIAARKASKSKHSRWERGT